MRETGAGMWQYQVKQGCSAARVWIITCATWGLCGQSIAENVGLWAVRAPGAAHMIHIDGSGLISWDQALVGEPFTLLRSQAESLSQVWAPVYHEIAATELMSVKAFDPTSRRDERFLPGGRFEMGDSLFDHGNITRPVHEVILNPFFMKQYEFTNREMEDVLQWAHDRDLVTVTNDFVRGQSGANLLYLGMFDAELAFVEGQFTVEDGRELHPVPNVSWYGAVSVCNFLSAMEGREECYNLIDWTCDPTKDGYRLPTEAEWECAARGGYIGMRFPWSDTDTITHDRANYRSDSTLNVYDVSPTQGFHPDYGENRPRSSPVGVFAPNNYELYDMCGNLLEWTEDWYARYSSGTQTNPVGPVAGTYKVVRGGSWFTTAERATVSMRLSFIEPSSLVQDIGFRIVRSYLPPEEQP